MNDDFNLYYGDFMKTEENKTVLFSALQNKYGMEGTPLHRNDIIGVQESLGIKGFPHWILNSANRVERAIYMFPPREKTPSVAAPVANAVIPLPVQRTNMNVESDGFNNLVPAKSDLYVPFGNYGDVKSIIASKMFYPLFITGLSGNGKTEMVEQACANNKRDMIRVNFTLETDEDDLIGGFRLVNGDTKFMKGPVIRAMEMGAVLLCDEIDLANPAKIMCLQSILENKGYLIKKTGEMIYPAPGFNIIATANTKGKGSDDGRFIATNVMNEAFLERFPVTFEQSYPSVATEKKILGKVFASLNIEDVEFINKLTDWADIIRKTFYDGGVDEVISTRRLVHIAKAYSIFKDRMKAIDVCISRFDDDTKLSFSDLYTKIDEDVNQDSTSEEEKLDTVFDN